MFKLLSPPTAIGLERTSQGIQCASLTTGPKNSLSLFTLPPEQNHVKPFDMEHPIITSGLEGREVLVRSLRLPVTKEKDIDAALAFQAEPFLPYPIDQAVLTYQTLEKSVDHTDLIFLAARKESIQNHVDFWHTLHIEPEKISSIPSALSAFAVSHFTSPKVLLLLHLREEEMTCALVKEGKLLASFAQSEGLNALISVFSNEAMPQNEQKWLAFEEHKGSPANDALRRLKQATVKMILSLAKEARGDSVEGIVLTGEAAGWEGFSQALLRQAPFPLIQCDATPIHSPQELLRYAVPIGLALNALPNQRDAIDFRQQELRYPHPWKRLFVPMAIYFVLVCLASLALYFLSKQIVHSQEDQVRRSYIDLLAGMHMSQEQFEKDFIAKNPQARKANGEGIAKVEELNQEEILARLAFLQNQLNASPDSFPLFANTPRVSDVLAWLNQHPAIAFTNEEGESEPRLQIENFSYIMVKRPQQGKKQEKYQVKIELELTSSTPKWAREFHDALITPNDWVDPKAEVKWNSNRGNYKTSFFLKDKTIYPST